MLLTRLSRNRLSYLGHYLKVKRYTNTLANYKINVQINNTNLNDYIRKLQLEYTELTREPNYISNERLNELQPLVNLLNERDSIVSNILSLKELIDSDDKEVSELAKLEKLELENKLNALDDSLVEALLPSDNEDSFNSIVLEVKAGVGGQEAMLFAQEIYNMYCSFIANKGWEYEIAEYLTTDLGGLRHASILIEGPQAFKYFKYEAGVHRVQRIPATEKSGRVHTSTVSVLALPQPSEIDIQIDPKDLKIETKRATGAGGQHVNTTDSAVRILHIPTNIAVECQVDRSQIKNRKLALARLRALLYEKELDQQLATIAAKRKSQVRSNNRNEKIRTYNFNQDRITDHRLQGVHCHNLKGFMENGVDLEGLIEKLDRQSKVDRLMELIEDKRLLKNLLSDKQHIDKAKIAQITFSEGLSMAETNRICPVLKYPEQYKPDTQDLLINEVARDYWLSTLERTVASFVDRAGALNPDNPKATEHANLCLEKFHSLVEKSRSNPRILNPLSVRTLLDFNEENLRVHFNDAWKLQKETETTQALTTFGQRIEKIDAISDFDEKWLEIIKGLLAGNVFDWGSQLFSDILENSPAFSLDHAMQRIESRPWFIDNVDSWIGRLNTASFKSAVVFVDNAGVDFVLGILPFIRELLSMGTRVIITANSYPSLNDVTFKELNLYCCKAAQQCRVLKEAIATGKLLTAANGQKGPCLDLKNIPAELCKLMADSDLIVLEGMGRSIHTNLHTEFLVDCLKTAVIKNDFLAKSLGASNQFSVVFKYEPSST